MHGVEKLKICGNDGGYTRHRCCPPAQAPPLADIVISVCGCWHNKPKKTSRNRSTKSDLPLFDSTIFGNGIQRSPVYYTPAAARVLMCPSKMGPVSGRICPENKVKTKTGCMWIFNITRAVALLLLFCLRWPQPQTQMVSGVVCVPALSLPPSASASPPPGPWPTGLFAARISI